MFGRKKRGPLIFSVGESSFPPSNVVNPPGGGMDGSISRADR